MSSTNPDSWYLAFAVGAGCIFAVIVAVAVLMQLARRIGVQLAEVAEMLAAISTDTAALPAIAGINRDASEMNEILANARQHLHRLVGGATP